MVKMTILLRAGVMISAGEAYNDFLMKLEALPGLRRKAVSDVYGSMSGPAPYTTLIEATFDSREALERALTSEPGVEAGHALLRFAGRDAVVLYASTLEEAYPGPAGEEDETLTGGGEV